MHHTRREFIKVSLASSAALALTPTLLAGVERRKRLRILILGGTGFLGPAIVEDALKRGHELTLFNRGKREKTKGTSFDDVTKLYGNRDPNKHAEDPKPEGPKGLEQIEAAVKAGTKWDAVIDTSGYVPRIVKASAELLAPAASHYAFVSTLSVYAKNDTPGMGEDAPLGTLADPTVETMGAQFENYGPLKALCEQAAEAAMPGRTLNVRPGYIVGVRDDTDRFSYWPVRTSQGGEMLVPGSPDDPVQFIDVRDLAAFILNAVERKVTGPINVCGPVGGTTWGALIDACEQSVRRMHREGATKVWIPADFLATQELGPGILPIWIPPEGEYAGFHRRSIDKAVKAGLTTRPAADTCAEILGWWPGEIERRTRVTKEMRDAAIAEGKEPPKMSDPTRLRTALPEGREAAVIAAWREKTK
ncbi:MAG: NAD-dependent epimerase/dehydratase family protein [Planctomycetota bacterium]|nr:NAD-dependent epimerase/dehydratase family protein [Planctomycetota bacterium]